MKSKPRASVKQQIERSRARREELWAKDLFGNLKKIDVELLNNNEIAFDPRSFPKSHFIVRSSPPKKGTSTVFIHAENIYMFSFLMKEGKVKTGVIANSNAAGKVKGYTVFKLDKTVSERVLSSIESYMKKPDIRAKYTLFPSGLIDSSKKTRVVFSHDGSLIKALESDRMVDKRRVQVYVNPYLYNKVLQEYLRSFGINLRIRYIAIPGSEFSKSIGDFVKDSSK